MNNYISTAPLYYDTYLAHHGIKGQKCLGRQYYKPKKDDTPIKET